MKQFELLPNRVARDSSAFSRREKKSVETAQFPPNIKLVLFLGDSITHAGAYIGYVETYFLTRRPKRRIEFINAGLSSETVSGLSEPNHADGKFPRPDLHQRLDRVLGQVKPDCVFACYGMNDGLFMKFDAGRFEKFREGINWLRQEVQKTGAKFVLLTPPTFDGQVTRNFEYVATLKQYADWELSLQESGLDIVNIHDAMNLYLSQRRKKEPDFAYNKTDGVHPNAQGHWIIARQILQFLGAKDIATIFDAEGMTIGLRNGSSILKLVMQRQELMRNAWLSQTGYIRPGLPEGLPMSEAYTKATNIDSQIDTLREGVR
jgi:lysophospholipase L1-like esterase